MTMVRDGAGAPSSTLPLAYYGVAYAGLAAGLVVLAIDPSLPGGSFYQPRFVALVHLLTLAWLTGSILGSLYIVGPLALSVPMPVRAGDWIAFGSFVFGLIGMVAHFWINTYDGMAWSAGFVIGAVTWVVSSVVSELREPRIPWPVRLHVVLAFLNILAAAGLGMVLGLDHSRGFLSVSPLAVMFAHAHIAAVGWVTMLVIGLAYRLIPMFLPARMPGGRPLALSAILLQGGLVVLTARLLTDSDGLWPGALLMIGGVASFVTQVFRMSRRRLPRPPALPARDWSTWQVHAACAWLLVAVVSGLVLAVGAPGEHRLRVMWIYGTSGLVGFLAQMVAGMQGRLLPLYAWYRVSVTSGGSPARSANALPSAAHARAIFLCWLAGVPLLVWGLPHGARFAIRAGALMLLVGLGVGASHGAVMLQRTGAAPPRAVPLPVPR